MTAEATGSARAARAAALLALCGLVLAVALLALAAAAYPGGHEWDPHAEGFHPGRNFWSDLLAPAARNGEPNGRSALLATWALRVFAAVLPVFWWLVPRLLPARRPLKWSVRALGLAAAAFAATVAPGALRLPHPFAILGSALPGLAALVLSAAAMPARSALRRLGLAAAGVIGAAVGVYVLNPAIEWRLLWALPPLQLIATAALVLWMAGALWQLARGRAVQRLHNRPSGR